MTAGVDVILPGVVRPPSQVAELLKDELPKDGRGFPEQRRVPESVSPVPGSVGVVWDSQRTAQRECAFCKTLKTNGRDLIQKKQTQNASLLQARNAGLFLLAATAVCCVGLFLFPASLMAQASSTEHAQHHPEQTKESETQEGKSETQKGSGMRDGKSGGKAGMMGGGKAGGGMGGMMEKMGAPKPKEMYPTLMDLPDLPLEERAEIEQQANQRIIEGGTLLSSGLEELSNARASDNFAAMQAASAKMREGLSRFESGLAARRALVEGKAPRNVALTWFKREMGLLPLAARPGFRFFGMTVFHTSVMALLMIFGVAMIWIYFSRMRRAVALMERLGTVPSPGGVGAAQSAVDARPMTVPAVPASAASRPTSSASKGVTSGAADCCAESAVECTREDEAADRADISQGLLRVAKRKLCKLRVAKIYQETPDVKTFRLVACHGGSLPFSYLPGQFLTLTLPTGEKPIRRSYTISSSPTQGYCCEITVKREEQGAGSRYLHDHVREGAMLDVQAPSGKFVFTGQEAEGVVLIAGGVGITPMMSITRALTDMGWPGDIDFLVACRDPEHFIFAPELERIAERHSNVHLHIAMSRIEHGEGRYHAGRLTKDLIVRSVPDITSKWIQLCGAPSMMAATKEMLAELGVPAESIHYESFGSQQKPHIKAAERKEVTGAATVVASATVNFATSGQATPLAPDETVLEAAERVDVNIDNSCRIGMCGVCAVKLLSGQVSMEVEDGLDPNDKEAGMILACQAKSTRDVSVEA